MGTPPPLARACALAAGLIALSSAPASGASETGFGVPRTIGTVNGFVASPAIGADGRAAVAMTDFATGRSRVLAVQRGARGRWSSPRVLRTSRQELFEPRAAFTGDGTGIFSWIRAVRLDQEQIVEARRMDGDGTFDRVRRLSPPGRRAVFSSIAPGPGARALVGWADDDLELRAAELDGGATGGMQTIFDQRQYDYAIAYLPDGTLVALGQSFGRGGVQVRLREPGGAWGEPAVLSGPRMAREASLAVGSDGTVAVAWAQSTEAGYRIQLSVRRPGDGAFSPARTLAGGDGEARAPALAVRPDGDVLVAWVAGARLGFLARGSEVRMVRVGADVSEPQRVSGARRRIAAPPQVLADAEGDALVTWEEGRRLVAAVREAGGRLAAPIAVSTPGVRVVSAQVVANARGQAIAAWSADGGRGGAVIQVAEAAF